MAFPAVDGELKPDFGPGVGDDCAGVGAGDEERLLEYEGGGVDEADDLLLELEYDEDDDERLLVEDDQLLDLEEDPLEKPELLPANAPIGIDKASMSGMTAIRVRCMKRTPSLESGTAEGWPGRRDITGAS